ncbi:MAG TPA: hypothetical protein VLH60_06350 [Sedimentisphaerales bacterium]|nr:hypothetical protein [Sedimentisphaerales bacterium]
MNKRQTLIIRHILVVLVVTTLFVFGLIHLRDAVNRYEAIREMGEVGRAIHAYRQQHGWMPPETWIEPLLERFVRLGNVQYRASDIFHDSPGDTILAYTKQRSSSVFVESGYIVLQLDCQVKWMSPDEFERLLNAQEAERSLQLFRLHGAPGD